MRLTDADKLKPLFSPTLTGKTTYTADEIMLSIISSPTVEAIPIEWIEKKITEYVISSRYGSDAVPIVYALLSDWRKENAGILQRD